LYTMNYAYNMPKHYSRSDALDARVEICEQEKELYHCRFNSQNNAKQIHSKTNIEWGQNNVSPIHSVISSHNKMPSIDSL